MELGQGTKELFDQKDKKRPCRYMDDELNNNTDDEDRDDNDVPTSSMNKAQTLLIQKSINN